MYIYVYIHIHTQYTVIVFAEDHESCEISECKHPVPGPGFATGISCP